MANPKRRHSNSRTANRRAHWRIKGPSLSICPECKRLKPMHRVCPYCGYYKGKKILELEE